MLSCVRGLFEKMQEWLERAGKGASQFVLKKGLGTADCITTLAIDLAEVYAHKSMFLAVFMDVLAAYDNVSIDILCDGLPAIECSTTVIKTIHSLVAKRQLLFYHENRWKPAIHVTGTRLYTLARAGRDKNRI